MMTSVEEKRALYSMSDAISINLKFVIVIGVFGVASDVNGQCVGTIRTLVWIAIPPVAVVVGLAVNRATLLPA